MLLARDQSSLLAMGCSEPCRIEWSARVFARNGRTPRGVASSESTAWALYQIDPHTADAVRPLAGVHEWLLSADAAGDAMRPRPSDLGCATGALVALHEVALPLQGRRGWVSAERVVPV